MSSDAQKEAYKRYNKKKTNFAIVYGANEQKEAQRLKDYISTLDISANSYLKELVKRDLDNKGISYDLDTPEQHNDI